MRGFGLRPLSGSSPGFLTQQSGVVAEVAPAGPTQDLLRASVSGERRELEFGSLSEHSEATELAISLNSNC